MNTRQLPWLGTPAPESHIAACGFRTGWPTDQPQPACLAEAKWHGIVLTDDGSGIRAFLEACDAHKPAMALSADFIHEYATACPLQEATTWWDKASGSSGCKIDWDTQALQAAKSAPVTA